MKNFRFLFVALIGLLTACSADEVVTTDSPQLSSQSLVLEVERPQFGDTNTRAAISGVSMSFESGDVIGVYAVDASGNTKFSNVAFTYNGSSWTSSTSVTFNSAWSYYAYYPYVSSPYTPDFTQSDIDDQFATFIADASDKFHLADQSTLTNFNASDLMIAKGEVSATNTVIFTMDHKKALAYLSGDAIDFADFSGNIPYFNGDYGYFCMKPNTSTTIGGYSMSTASGKYIECIFSPAALVSSATDVSMYNTAGVLQSSRNTANCYLVHDAGIYKLPLVYGNAIKDGSTNSLAYRPSSGSSSDTYLMPFVNHADAAITDPWLKNNGATPDEASLLWQDASGLIDAVAVSGNYLLFKVPSAASSKAGNAVIAATKNGTVVWSWHIWVTTETLSNTSVVATGSHNYTVAPVNLGWIATGGDGKQGYCPYYQWGRKDAFVPSSGSTGGNTNKTVYDIDGNTITGYSYAESTTATIGTDIQNPTVHYFNSTTYGPQTGQQYNLWDVNQTGLNNITTATVKTIYDPCPAGFCVPTGNLYYFIGSGGSTTMSTWDSTNLGATWSTGVTGDELFFPAAGSRDLGSAGLYYVGSYGYCWSASAISGTNGRSLDFNSSLWYWVNDYRAYGFSVRPVAEE